MEALLIDEWLGDHDAIAMLDDASVSVVRERVRAIGAAQGLAREDIERLAVAASELGTNQLRHAVHGRMAVRAIDGGVEVIAADRGQGIADPTRALEGRPRDTGSLGVGLAAVLENADEVDFDVRIGEGTCVWARKLAVKPTRRRRQVGIFGRALPGEPRSGDHACFARTEGRLVAGVCDGLGHGEAARSASTVAAATFRENASASPEQILEACHEAMGPTRGGVMAVTRFSTEGDFVETAGIGNVTIEIMGPRTSRRFGGSSFVLGSPQRGRRTHLENVPLRSDDSIVLFTDGVSSRAALGEEPSLFFLHPIAVAHQILVRHGKENDDALVLVAR
jgi:anti-sigma regulatory factor (Ser/Thr protein kinase)